MAKKRKADDPAQSDPAEAGRWLYKQVAMLGMECPWLFKHQGRKAVEMLRRRIKPEEVAQMLKIASWSHVWASDKQLGLIRYKGLPTRARTKWEASLILDAHFEPERLAKRLIRDITKAVSDDELDGIGKDVALVRDVLPARLVEWIAEHGKERRAEIAGLAASLAAS